MSAGQVKFRLELEAPGEAELEAWAIGYLKERGFSVQRPNENWETVKAFCARLRITYMTLPRNMARPGCPNAIVRRGFTGRIVEILSNPDFDNFITANKRRLHRLTAIEEKKDAQKK